MDEELKLLKRLEEMREKHRLLDEQIKELERSPMNALRVKLLKREKLELRDKMGMLERELYPDIIA